MKSKLALGLTIMSAILTTSLSAGAADSVYDIPLKDIDGKDASLKPYKGDVILVVNVASKCGFTPQYTGLEALYKKYAMQGLTVCGFPCNQFGKQEPGTDAEIQEFCKANYCVGVGSGTDALRFALTAAGVCAGDIVITAPNTFIATTEAISQVGAAFEFVDIEEGTCNIDAAKLREHLETECYVDGVTGKLISRRSARPV